MGEVYEAQDELLKRRVALKTVIPREGFGDEDVREVLREARRAAALDHPNVVSVFDVGSDEGQLHIVMELVAGESLRDELERGHPLEERIRWTIEVARALEAAHNAGLIHRDIKPENVMLRADGVVKVLDFGIARRAPPEDPGRLAAWVEEASTVDAQDQATCGTPGYIAPEGLLDGTSSPRSDQFSWGVFAYEVISGRLPWNSVTAPALIGETLTIEPPPLEQQCNDAGPLVSSVVMRALKKEPGERFPSMTAVVEAMRSAAFAVPSLPPQARSHQPPANVPRERSTTIDATTERYDPRGASALPPAIRPAGGAVRSRTAMVAGLAGVLTVLGLSGYLLTRPHPRRATAPTSSAQQALPVAPAISVRNRRRLTIGDRCEEDPAFTPDGGSLLIDAPDGEDYHLAVLDLASGARRWLAPSPGWQFSPALSADGREVAYLGSSSRGNDTMIVPLDGSSPPRMIAAGDTIRPAFSFDQKGVWGGTSEMLVLYDRATLKELKRVSPPKDITVGRVVEARGGQLVLRARDPARRSIGIALFDPERKVDRWIYQGPVERTLALFPQRDAVLFEPMFDGESASLLVSSLDGSIEQSLLDVHASAGVAVSPDGNRIAWSTCRAVYSVLSARPDATDMTPIRANNDYSDVGPVWLPSRRSFAVVSNRGGARAIWIEPLGEGQAKQLSTNGLAPKDLAVSPDERELCFSTRAGLYAVSVDRAESPRRLTDGPADAAPTYARDGRTIFFERRDEGRSRVFSVPSSGGSASPLLPAEKHELRAPVASPVADELLAIRADGSGRFEIVRAPLSAPGEEELKTFARLEIPATNLAISPDGRFVAAGWEQSVAVYLASTGEIVTRYPRGASSFGPMSFTNDKLLLTRGAWRGGLWIADVDFPAAQ